MVSSARVETSKQHLNTISEIFRNQFFTITYLSVLDWKENLYSMNFSTLIQLHEGLLPDDVWKGVANVLKTSFEIATSE